MANHSLTPNAMQYSMQRQPTHGARLSPQDKSIRIFRNGVKIQELKGHKSPVIGVVVLENGLLASASSDGEVKVWSGTGGGKKPCTVLKTLTSKNLEECTAIVAMHNGDIAVGSESGKVVIWRPRGPDDPPASSAPAADDDDDETGARSIRDDTRGTLEVGKTAEVVVSDENKHKDSRRNRSKVSRALDVFFCDVIIKCISATARSTDWSLCVCFSHRFHLCRVSDGVATWAAARSPQRVWRVAKARVTCTMN